MGEKAGKADKAFHPDEIRRAPGVHKIGELFVRSLPTTSYADEMAGTDFEVYIASQILPPIERLCDAIEGTDRSRLAECLGQYFAIQFDLS